MGFDSAQSTVYFSFRADRAESGEEAIRQLRQADRDDPYQLILMDWNMPGMDGIETTQMIRSDPHLPHTPVVIMVSAYGRAEAQQVSEGVELAGFLAKPVTASALHDAILLAMGQRALEPRAPRQQPELTQARPKLAGAKLLLVEDNEVNQELALELLTSNGLKVWVANNGAEALELLERETFDGVLMDIQMPMMDGYTATRKIQEQARFKALPIIALTANAMSGDRERVLAAGMNDHIAKPIEVTRIFNTLAKWLRKDEPMADRPPITPATQPDAAPLPDLPGVDSAAGLTIVQGNLRLYRRLLLKFRDQQRDFEHQFRIAQADSDPNAASRMAHTLKGVAGNLGIKGVQAAALKLEKTCREGGADMDEPLVTVVAELQRVLAGLDTLDTTPQGIATGVPPLLDLSSVVPLLRELHHLVATDNIRAIDIMERLMPLLAGHAGLASQLEHIATALEGYDFDQALVALQALAGELNMDL